MAKVPGLAKGLGVTFRTMLRGAVTVQYPHEKEEPPTRARGVIALKEENCTVCMLCARSCPDWCIYIEGHKEKRPPRREGGRERTVNVLDRFDIDYALCMYCGICVEVCPFDALFWSPEYEYSEHRIADLLHLVENEAQIYRLKTIGEAWKFMKAKLDIMFQYEGVPDSKD